MVTNAIQCGHKKEDDVHKSMYVVFCIYVFQIYSFLTELSR